jgi:EmrB/QacA subfamily drug resistance transporter
MRLDSAPGRWLLAVAVLGSGIAFLDATVVNVALPDIGRDLHASISTLQWILNGYVLTLASLILLGGSLGDRYGRRRIFVYGTGLFTVASLLCAVAPNAELLVAARLVQGVGGALLTPGSLAMVESGFRPADRARAIGAWSGLGGVAGALGPLIGGLLVGAVSWRAVFVINLPLGIFIVVMARRHVPETRDPAPEGRLDSRGVILAAVGLAGTTYALIEAPGRGASPLLVAIAVGGGLALIAFLIAERRSPNPMMPLSMFASRQFSAANAVTFVVFGALSGVFFLLVAFLQISLGYSPLAAGAASLPITALMLLLSVRAGAVAERIGPRIPLTVGPLIAAVGLLLMTRINAGDSYASSVLPAVIVFGLGLTLVVAPVTATVMATADERHSGIASGINTAVSRLASLIVVAVLPLIAGLTGRKFYDPSAMVHGFHVAMLACATLAVAGGVLAWLTISSEVLKSAPTPSTDLPTGVLRDFSCAVAGPPLRPGREADTRNGGPSEAGAAVIGGAGAA